jgi:hypothetical protein
MSLNIKHIWESGRGVGRLDEDNSQRRRDDNGEER